MIRTLRNFIVASLLLPVALPLSAAQVSNVLPAKVQQSLSRRDVAQFLNLHPNHISRLFAQFGGESFHHYVLQARLDRAADNGTAS